jgi:hypothetical protein
VIHCFTALDPARLPACALAFPLAGKSTNLTAGVTAQRVSRQFPPLRQVDLVI